MPIGSEEVDYEGKKILPCATNQPGYTKTNKKIILFSMAAGMIAVAGTPIGLLYGANAGWMFETVALNTGETWNQAAGNPHYWWVWLLALLGIFFVPLVLLIVFYIFYAIFSFRFWELSADITKQMFFNLYYLFLPYRMT